MSSVCSLNLTIGVFYVESLTVASILKVNKKSISGTIGRHFDSFIAGNHERRCQFIATNSLLNNTIKLLKENQIDFYLNPESLFGNLLGVEYSTAFYSEKIYLGHLLDQPKGINNDGLAFVNYSKLIVLFLIIGFLLKLLFIFIFLSFKIKDNWNSLSLILKRLQKYYHYYMSVNFLKTKLNLIMIFYLLFKHLNFILLTNNIKTNEVILNLDQLIDTRDKLFKIDRFSCWMENSSWFNFVIKSDKNSLIHKVYDLKRKSNDICYLDHLINDHIKLKQLDLAKNFFILDRSSLLCLFLVLSQLIELKQKIAFMISSILGLELIQVHFISAKLNSNWKSSLLSKILDYHEYGIYKKFYSDYEFAISKSMKIDNLYDNAGNIKKNFIKISPLNLDYFFNLFILVFSFNICILIVFIFKISHQFLIKKIRILLRNNLIIRKIINFVRNLILFINQFLDTF